MGVSGEDERAKVRKERRCCGRCPAGRRLVLGGGASRPRGPRPDASPATASRRPTSASVTAARRRPCASRTARSSRSAPRSAARARTSRSPATTPTARSTRASPATASRRPTSASFDGRTGWRSRATARSSWSASRRPRRRLRARPLQPERLARHELLRRRQADDRLRGHGDRANGVALQGDGKIVAVGSTSAPRRRLRARPLQPQRLARHELLRRRQADDRLRGVDAGERGGAPGRRQDRRCRLRGGTAATTSRSPATTRTARSTRASPATASRPPTSGAPTGERGGAPGRRQDRRGRPTAAPASGDFALARYNPERLARHELLRRRQADDRLRGLRRGERGGAPGRRQDRRGRRRRTLSDFALARYNANGSLDTSFSGDGKQTTNFGGLRRGERGGAPGRRQDRRGRRTAATAATSRSPATTRTARSTRASPATASRRPTSGASTRRAGWRSRRTARSSRLAAPAAPTARRRLRARPLQPERLARHELLRRRQADDRLRGLRRTRPGWRSRATARSSWSAARQRHRRPTSRSPATTPTARSTRASPATASRRPTSGGCDGANGGGAPGRRQDRRGRWHRRRRRLRARPLQPQRLARHELLRRRQADDRLRGLRRGERGGAPGDGKIVAVGQRRGPAPATSRSPATTRTARSTRASPATASRRPTSAGSDGASGVALQADGKIVAVGCRRRHRRLRARPLQPQRLARHELLGRRQADDRLRRAATRRTGWRSRATARSSRSARRGGPGSRLRARPLQPATARSTRASPATASRRPTSAPSAGERGGAPGRRQDRRCRGGLGTDGTDDFALARYLGG